MVGARRPWVGSWEKSKTSLSSSQTRTVSPSSQVLQCAMEKSKLIAPGAGGVKKPVHRTEKVIFEMPATGEAPFQSKSIARSIRLRTGLPANPADRKSV